MVIVLVLDLVNYPDKSPTETEDLLALYIKKKDY